LGKRLDASAKRLVSTFSFRKVLYDLRDELIKLRPTQLGYVARVIPNAQWARLAVGQDSLALIVAYSPGQRRYNVDLKHLLINFDQSVVVHHHGNPISERVAILETKGLGADLQNVFIEVMALVLTSIHESTENDMGKLLSNMVELFQLMSSPSKKSAVGLWGELFVISQSRNPEKVVLNWHSTNMDRYDFSREDVRVEIKTSLSVRSHYFSLEQLAHREQLRVYVGSVLTESLEGGTSCVDLIDSISPRLTSDESRLHLTRTALTALGRNWDIESEVCFNAQLASQSLRWYPADVIPQITQVPEGVSEVKFRSDLQVAAEIATDVFALEGEFPYDISNGGQNGA
jgi:hypothetical protein